jgi:hypothetical protein
MAISETDQRLRSYRRCELWRRDTIQSLVISSRRPISSERTDVVAPLTASAAWVFASIG